MLAMPPLPIRASRARVLHVKIDSEHLPYALRGLVLKEGSKVLKVSKAAKGVPGLKVLKALGRGAANPSKAALSFYG